MTRWLRAVGTTGLLVALGAAGTSWGAGGSYGAESAPSGRRIVALDTVSPSAEPSRAGSRAGEGRERPGRRVDAGAEEVGAEEVGAEAEAGRPPEGVPTAVPPPTRQAVPADAVPTGPVSRAQRPAEPVLRILPLGSGLVLIGLGLGLAFIGLRVRRG
ncbi:MULTISPECIES: hypothetical protein [unclassified Streptomyces]|uniref:hypothetical protein n=1 Tax=unclassified Streptomyces TaxID=2593676 RepID=UPI0036ECAFEB